MSEYEHFATEDVQKVAAFWRRQASIMATEAAQEDLSEGLIAEGMLIAAIEIERERKGARPLARVLYLTALQLQKDADAADSEMANRGVLN